MNVESPAAAAGEQSQALDAVYLKWLFFYFIRFNKFFETNLCEEGPPVIDPAGLGGLPSIWIDTWEKIVPIYTYLTKKMQKDNQKIGQFGHLLELHY